MARFDQLIPKKHIFPAAILLLVLIAGVAFYVNLYTSWIVGTTAVPTYDQAGYFIKTYNIAILIHKNAWNLINPMTYLAGHFAYRPPLMMALAAWILGPTFNYQAVMLVWFAARFLGLLSVLGMLAWRMKNAWWVPAAALTILCAPGWLRVYPNIMMVDECFEVGVLFAFACIVWDLRARTVTSVVWAVAGFLTALFIKPAGPVVFLPWLLFLGWQLIRGRLRGGRLIVFLAGALVVIGMALSPFGAAVAHQYAEGMMGWWNFPLTFLEKIKLLQLLLPAWLMVALVVSIAVQYRRRRSSSPPQDTHDDLRYFGITALVLVTWWYIFNGWITYTMDIRILPGAMPIAVVGACVWLIRGWRSGLILTTVGALVFGWSMLIATGAAAPTPLVPWVESQKPIAEVGVYDIAMELKKAVPPQKSLLIAIDDHFVEQTSISLAWVQIAPGQPLPNIGGIAGRFWGRKPALASQISGFDYVLTKKKNSMSELSANAGLSLHAIEDLVRMPASPISKYYTPVWTLPTHQPGYDDEVTLYSRAQAIPPEDLAAGDKFADRRMSVGK